MSARTIDRIAIHIIVLCIILVFGWRVEAQLNCSGGPLACLTGISTNAAGTAITALGVNVAAPGTGGITTTSSVILNGGSVQVQANQGYFFNGQGGLQATADGVFTVKNNAQTSIGGITASFISLSSTGGSSPSISSALPTVSSGCGSVSTPTFGVGSTATSWSLTMGSTPGTSCVITLPTATNQWICFADDISTIADTTTQATPLANNAATLKPLVSWAASDVLVGHCFAH